jgi:hypothetical protein
MNELLGAVSLIGVALIFTGIVMRLRALIADKVANRASNRASDTEVLQRMEREARRAGRVLVVVGAYATVLGFIGWVLTR